jgi:phospholipase/carboxylesterase
VPDLTRRALLQTFAAAALAGGEQPGVFRSPSWRFPSSRSRHSTLKPESLGLSPARDGSYYVPVAAARADHAPLLLFLHGAGGSGGHAIERLVDDAERSATIVVAPDSRGATWGITEGSEEADRHFLDRALARFFREYPIDRDRVAIAGFSDGASAALSWGVANPALFSATIAFSPGFLRRFAEASEKTRIFISHGTKDEILSFVNSRQIATALSLTGHAVRFREFDGGHTVPPGVRREAFDWFVGR